jgi:hypothetical protein
MAPAAQPAHCLLAWLSNPICRCKAPDCYQVTLEANNRPWLLLLDAATQPNPIQGYSPTMTPDLQWQVERPISDLVRYSAQSNIQFRHGPLNPVVHRLQDYLDLPLNFNPRTLQLAVPCAAIRAMHAPMRQRWWMPCWSSLRTGGYTYTLEPGVFGTHTADEFWFDRKAGFCEHIASSFVSADACHGHSRRGLSPVTRGGLSKSGGRLLDGASKRCPCLDRGLDGRAGLGARGPHLGRGTRTYRQPGAPDAPGVFDLALDRVSPQFSLNLRALWEAANNRWNQWVLNYSQSRQLNLLRNLGFESPSWADLSYVLIGVVVSPAWWALRGRCGSATGRIRGCVCCTVPPSTCASAGLNAVHRHTPPRQMAALAAPTPRSQPCTAWQSCQTGCCSMEAWRYAPGSAPQQLATLQRTVPSPALAALHTA